MKTGPAEKFAGLSSVDVTARFNTLIQFGFYVELLVGVLVILSLVCKMRLLGLCSSCFGHLSLLWFVLLLFARYDHYGKVCSGDYLKPDADDKFPNLSKAGEFLMLYANIIFISVAVLFVFVVVYSCCVDPRVGADGDEKK